MNIQKELNITFGKFLKSIRQKSGNTQAEFCFNFGIEQSYYSQIELGQIGTSILTFLKISEGLNMKPTKLIKQVFFRKSNPIVLMNFSPQKLKNTDNFTKNLGHTIAELRKSQNLNSGSIVFQSQISQRNYTIIEAEGSNMSLATFIAIADALQVAPDYILKLALKKTKTK